jgi:hypothetical protein
MVGQNHRNRTPGEMTIQQLARIRRLNDRLCEAESLIRDGALSGRYSDVGAANPVKEQEEIDVHVLVKCVAHRGPSDSRCTIEATVACLNCTVLLDTLRKKVSPATEPPKKLAAPPLSDMPVCGFFVELLEGELGGDWERLLTIDEVCVECSLLRRWSERWEV